jgi:hypothetical protein
MMQHNMLNTKPNMKRSNYYTLDLVYELHISSTFRKNLVTILGTMLYDAHNHFNRPL